MAESLRLTADIVCEGDIDVQPIRTIVSCTSDVSRMLSWLQRYFCFRIERCRVLLVVGSIIGNFINS